MNEPPQLCIGVTNDSVSNINLVEEPPQLDIAT